MIKPMLNLTKKNFYYDFFTILEYFGCVEYEFKGILPWAFVRYQHFNSTPINFHSNLSQILNQYEKLNIPA